MFLSCHSYFSFHYGVMSIEELLNEAVRHGIGKFVLTDINNTSGILDFHRLAAQFGIRPVCGIDFREGPVQKFIAIAKNAEGFRELNLFLSKCLNQGEPGLAPKDAIIPDRAPEFQNAFVIYPFSSFEKDRGNRHEGDGGHSSVMKVLGVNEFIGIRPSELNRFRFSSLRNQRDKVVALAPVTFRSKTDFNVHRLLRAVDNNILLSKLDGSDQSLPDEVMMSEEQLCALYHDFPFIIQNTQKLLEACESIDFEFGKNKNKKTFTGTVRGDSELLLKLCHDNLPYRYPKKEKKIVDRFRHEISVITDLGFASYFLINWDIVRYAQHRNFFYVGRGSGANSMVAYLLRITDVDPVELDLYFERFINAYRTSPPDFDIDFSWNDRDEVIEYIFKRNLTEHTALLATYSTFQSDSVVRELGKVFGLPKREIDVLQDPRRFPPTHDHITKLIYQYARLIHDFPSHLSIHAGGILISERPVTYYTALSNPPKGFPLAQFSMLEAEDVGLYKFDILSQRGLGKIKDAGEVVKKNQGIDIDIHDVNRFKKDKEVSRHLKEAKLMGCFYVESPAMRMLLTKLRASTYLDLVAASSIIRPGVAQSGMMQEYIRRFHDPSRRQYAHPLMKELMDETFGIMVYQEDVIKVAHYFAGLTLTEADMLRRGMSGKYRGRAEFAKVEAKFFSNCKEKGYADEVTAEVWRQIESFAGYAFSKGHSASYAVESYQCMFLKVHYPLEFMVAVINNGGGFFGVEYYIHEARMCGASIHAPHVNHSEALTCIEGKDVYLGFGLIKDVDAKTVDAIVTERQREGKFDSLSDFLKRVSVSVDQLRLLIRIGAFRFTGKMKQELMWDIHAILGSKKKSEARKELFDSSYKNFQLPRLDEIRFRNVVDQIEILGFPLCSPFELIERNTDSDQPHLYLDEREEIDSSNVKATASPELATALHSNATKLSPLQGESVDLILNQPVASDLKNFSGKRIEITGYYVTYKPTRTKKGKSMMFGCFLDRDGFFFDTNHFPEATKRFPFRGKGCYRIKGKVAEEFGFYSINVEEMHKIDYVMYEEDAEMLARSRPDPVVVPPVVSASHEFEYLLVLLLPPHVEREVMLLKKEFHRQFNHYRAVTDEPRIILCRLTESGARETELIQQVAAAAASQPRVKMALDGFSNIPHHTVHVELADAEVLSDVIDCLRQEVKCGGKSRWFNSRPTVTIARGLDKEKFARATAAFCRREYAIIFLATTVVLLKRRAGESAMRYEMVKQFRLAGKSPSR